MLFGKQELVYSVPVPPVRKPFVDMTHEETEAYFRWHQAHLEERIAYLSQIVSRQMRIPADRLDLSPRSLIPVWRWFLKIVENRKHIKFFLQVEKEPSGTIVPTEWIADKEKHCYSLLGEMILKDIAMYLGQVFVQNEEGTAWTYFEQPKREVRVNMPCVSGFEDNRFTPPFQMFFEPVNMTMVQAAKMWSSEESEEDLYNLYQLWKPKIPRRVGTC